MKVIIIKKLKSENLQSSVSVQVEEFQRLIIAACLSSLLDASKSPLHSPSQRPVPSFLSTRFSPNRCFQPVDLVFSFLSNALYRHTGQDPFSNTQSSFPDPRKFSEACRLHVSYPTTCLQVPSWRHSFGPGPRGVRYCPTSVNLSVICDHIFLFHSTRFST